MKITTNDPEEIFYYPRLPLMTDKEKQKAYKIIEESIIRAKELAKKQKDERENSLRPL